MMGNRGQSFGKQARRLLCCFVVLCLISTMSFTALADVGRRYNYFNKSYTLTGNGGIDMVAVAEKQIGATTSSLGYSGAWCAAFVNDCAELAGQTYAIPFVSGSTHAVSGLRTWILNRGGTTVTTAQAGDIVIYYCTVCGSYCHCGIMANANRKIIKQSGNLNLSGMGNDYLGENRFSGLWQEV